MPFVNFYESNFRLDLRDCVDACHALAFAQLGPVVEDGRARRIDVGMVTPAPIGVQTPRRNTYRAGKGRDEDES